MHLFVQKYAPDVIGVLSGFDRLVFRGHIRQLGYVDGLQCYLALHHLPTGAFKQHALELTAQLKEAVEAPVRRARRPIQYLPSTRIDKERLVHDIVARDRIRTGPIALLTCVEPCRTFELHSDREKKTIALRPTYSRCTYFYKYAFHPQLGYYHARIQSWFPFNVQVNCNGREWLSRQLDRARLRYRRADNTFVWLEDLAHAQRLLAHQLRTDWVRLLDGLVTELNPLHPAMFTPFRAPYYWSTYQVEWASDVLFASPAALRRLYGVLPRHAITTLSCRDILRFLGALRPGKCGGEVHGKFSERDQGVRIKHSAAGNSLKVYDKAYAVRAGDWSVLRFENTVTNPAGYKAFRPREGDPDGPKSWLPLRKGVADLHRLAEIAQAANDRYAAAMVACDSSASVAQTMLRLTLPVVLDGRRLRGLRPWAADDLALLRAVNRGEYALNGLRNRDLRAVLYPKPLADAAEQRRRSARVSRLLRLLRAHGLIRKVPKTHRYQVTANGRTLLATVLTAVDTTVAQLAQLPQLAA